MNYNLLFDEKNDIQADDLILFNNMERNLPENSFYVYE